jgi:DNA-dependent RNA polymerase auxiliary subunit epsilon
MNAARVSLLRWIRRQLRVPLPAREHLEAAVVNNDPAEARRLLRDAPFSVEQRHHLEQLLEAWEREAS